MNSRGVPNKCFQRQYWVLPIDEMSISRPAAMCECWQLGQEDLFNPTREHDCQRQLSVIGLPALLSVLGLRVR